MKGAICRVKHKPNPIITVQHKGKLNSTHLAVFAPGLPIIIIISQHRTHIKP